MSKTTTRLQRLPQSDFGLSRYLHPGGFVIERCRRTWSERNGNQIGGGAWLYWYEIREHVSSTAAAVPSVYHPWAVKDGYKSEDVERLAEARAWCDAHWRTGWER